ncbi:hypothetical protein [Algivirga pacifica]|uniref:PRA1 family protein n=1 Tax=Algivirga pacifica TaxID=1162670 RepID=A0ABP9DJA7_9BACT
MRLIPKKNITIVLPFPAQEVKHRLHNATLPLGHQPLPGYEQHFTFNGTVQHYNFRISKIMRSPQDFAPIIEGNIEPCQHGALVFATFHLFKSTSLMFYFGMAVCLTLLYLFLFLLTNWVYVGLTLLAMGLHICVMHLSFKKQVKIGRKALEDVLFSNNKEQQRL